VFLDGGNADTRVTVAGHRSGGGTRSWLTACAVAKPARTPGAGATIAGSCRTGTANGRGSKTWRDGTRGIGTARTSSARAAEEDLAEIIGKIDRLDILDVVDKKLGGAFIAGTVKSFEPFFRLAQVFRLRRDRNDRIRALDRNETKHAGQW